MKNFVKKFLLCTALTAGAVSNITLLASNPCNTSCKTSCEDKCGDCNKTFMAVRSHGTNLARERSAGWQELIHSDKKDSFGGNFQLGFFYQASTNSDDTARYFGPCKTKDCPTDCTVKTDCAPCDKNDGVCWTFGDKAHSLLDPTTGVVTDQDLNIRCFIHDSGNPGAAEGEKGKLCLDPDQKAYGFNLYYYQCLSKIYKGLFMTVNLPIVHVENDLNACFSGTQKEDLQKYFRGDVVNENQEKLNCLLFGSDCSDRSTTSVADIDVRIGYNFYKTEKYYAGVNFGFTIPTGTESSAKYLFPAVVGNHDHWAIGFGLDAGARVWGDEESNIKLYTVFDFRYLFEDCECRTVGLKGDDCNWEHYELLGYSNNGTPGQKLVPAANLLCTKVDVTPGSQINWLLGGAYNWGNFSFDLGYELFWRDDEDVCLKGCEIFGKEQYGFAAKTFEVGVRAFGTDALDFKGVASTGTLKWLSDSDIDTSRAATPSLLTHKIYGGLSYTFSDWDLPFLIGAGAHYEFGSGNENLETWGINVKTGVKF